MSFTVADDVSTGPSAGWKVTVNFALSARLRRSLAAEALSLSGTRTAPAAFAAMRVVLIAGFALAAVARVLSAPEIVTLPGAGA